MHRRVVNESQSLPDKPTADGAFRWRDVQGAQSVHKQFVLIKYRYPTVIRQIPVLLLFTLSLLRRVRDAAFTLTFALSSPLRKYCKAVFDDVVSDAAIHDAIVIT